MGKIKTKIKIEGQNSKNTCFVSKLSFLQKMYPCVRISVAKGTNLWGFWNRIFTHLVAHPIYQLINEKSHHPPPITEITRHNYVILRINYRLQNQPQIHASNLRGLLVYSIYHSHQLHLTRWVIWCLDLRQTEEDFKIHAYKPRIFAKWGSKGGVYVQSEDCKLNGEPHSVCVAQKTSLQANLDSIGVNIHARSVFIVLTYTQTTPHFECISM